MKNSFCRICRGRFNLKYPPAAVDSKIRKLNSRFIAARIDESGEYSDNICWDCEDTLLGFHKSVSEDNDDEEEPVVVDDDEILYKSLEKTIRTHRFPKAVEIIKIDSSDSEHEERVIVPKQDDIVRVESASTTVGYSKNNCESYLNYKAVAVKRNIFNEMNSDLKLKKDNISRSKVFESMRCPLCPYLSGIEYEVVFHIRRNHPHYTGDHLRFEHQEGDSILTRRIIFVQLWTFFECKACGKLHDRFWPHRKHLTAHDRKCLQDTFDDDILAPNNNELFNSHDPTDKVQTSKRALDLFEDMRDPKSIKTEDRNLRRNSKDNNFVETTSKPLALNISKSLQNGGKPHQPQHQQFPSDSKKSKSKGLLRKQQMMQMKREKRAQKRTEKKKAQPKKSASVIPKPTFKMPQQPAPRASTVVKQILHNFRFTCKFCTETLSTFISWNMHMIRVHSITEFNTNSIVTSNNNVCKKCDKSFASVGEVRLHIQLSHRRKYRLVEINGNDDEEICRQTLTPKKESKDEIVSGDKMSVLMNGTLEPPEPPNVTMSSAFLCQYCGILFPTLMACAIHQTSHVVNSEVKRIFPTKSQA